MDTKDIAQWIAIAVTLIISVLVPLLTQIANNKHQEKMQKAKLEREKEQEKELAYREFLSEVNTMLALSGYSDRDNIAKAGASVGKLYMFAPADWWNDIDELATNIKEFNYDEVRRIMFRLSPKIVDELNKQR